MSYRKKDIVLVVDKRELATILATLRFHQDENLRDCSEIPDQAIKDIATDHGSLKPLDFNDINRLCERINTSTSLQEKNWLLIVTLRGKVVYIRTFETKTAAKKGLFEYMKDYQKYDGPKNMDAMNKWIKVHDQHLRFNIVRLDEATGSHANKKPS